MIKYINIQGYFIRLDADLGAVTELVREMTVKTAIEAEMLIDEWSADGLKVTAIVAYEDKEGEFLFNA